MIEKKLFRKITNDCEVFLYTIEKKEGTKYNIINYIAIATNLSDRLNFA